MQFKSDPESEHFDASQPDEALPSESGSRETQQPKKNAVRKRTKTGCLSMSNDREEADVTARD